MVSDPEAAWQLEASPAAPRGTPVPADPSPFSPTTPPAVRQELGLGPALPGHGQDVPLGWGSGGCGAGGELPWLCTEQH